MPSPDHYIPGVCNIGPAEIKTRRISGIGGLVVALALYGVLRWSGVAAPWRLLVFFPATISASGFLQAALHFCLGFGFMSVFNFGERGRTDSVLEAEFRRLDRRKARVILAGALAIGLAAALAATLI
jgi:hypothetical protein